MDLKTDSIRISEKIAWNTEEASIMSGISPEWFRYAAHLTSLGQFDLPWFPKGKIIMIPSQKFTEWLGNASDGHHDFRISLMKKRVKEAIQSQHKAGRKKKIR